MYKLITSSLAKKGRVVCYMLFFPAMVLSRMGGGVWDDLLWHKFCALLELARVLGSGNGAKMGCSRNVVGVVRVPIRDYLPMYRSFNGTNEKMGSGKNRSLNFSFGF